MNENEEKNINNNQEVNDIKKVDNVNEKNEQNTDSVQETQPKKKSKVWIIVLIGILVLLLILVIPITFIVLGVIVFKNSKSNVNRDLSRALNEIDSSLTREVDDISKAAEDMTKATDILDSTKEKPLNINQWGKAAKYVSSFLSEKYDNVSYVDVPTRVTKITRGSEAESIVKTWYEKQSTYKYEEPEEGTEWAVVDYQVDLSDITFDAGTIGTSIDISSDIEGIDGLSVKYNGNTYILSTIDISDDEYVKEPKVYNCKFITTLPIGCKDYIIILGNDYSGSKAYIKGE